MITLVQEGIIKIFDSFENIKETTIDSLKYNISIEV
jgi:hypothetical protein